MAVLADDIGAVVGLWKPGAHPGAGIVNEPGAFCWSELVTTDVPASTAFCTGLFGWWASTYEQDGIVQYVEWKLRDRTIGGMLPRPAEMPDSVPAHWAVALGSGHAAP